MFGQLQIFGRQPILPGELCGSRIHFDALLFSTQAQQIAAAVAEGIGPGIEECLDAEELVDVLVDAEGVRTWRRPKLATRHTHGTGCTLSAAITAGLAHGRGLREAVGDGLDYAHRAIAAAPGLGSGHGPLNHLVPARG